MSKQDNNNTAAGELKAGDKVVLGFSGGLDTSYCVKYLTDEKGYEVHSVIVNTGGFNQEEIVGDPKQGSRLAVYFPDSIDFPILGVSVSDF